MYCAFFGFREKPFNITPDPSFIYFSGTHREAFAHLLYGIDNHVGFMVIAGEVGTGKTTILRTLLSQLDAGNYRTALIFNPCLSSAGLMQGINREYGLPYKDLNDEELLDTLNQFLLQQNTAGNTVVLVIDEAQNLQRAVLEQIRLISNLETERDKLIQIVLAGQPELEKVLARPELRQLNQRIAVRYHLGPMDLEDTKDYISHRLTIAGSGRPVAFSERALKAVFRFSRGVPRLINIICDRALLVGYTKGQWEISSRLVAIAAGDIRKTEENRHLLQRLRPAGMILVALFVAAGILGISRTFTREPVTEHTAENAVGAAKRNSSTTPDFAGNLHRIMSGMTEAESAVQAFNALAVRWKAEPFPVSRSPEQGVTLEYLTSTRSLQLYRFSGNLGSLLRTDSPAILELALPGSRGKRYLALLGRESGRLLIHPPIMNRAWLTPDELEGVWSGRSYLPWKNFLDIPPGLRPGATGEPVGRLQSLLGEAGVYLGPSSGVYDKTTVAAVENFQAKRGIAVDGFAGNHTLMLLYRAAGRYFPPQLTKKGGLHGE